MEQLADTMFYLIRGILLDEETTDIMDKYLDDKEIFWDQYCNYETDPVPWPYPYYGKIDGTMILLGCCHACNSVCFSLAQS
jgi:hypothetical protein